LVPVRLPAALSVAGAAMAVFSYTLQQRSKRQAGELAPKPDYVCSIQCSFWNFQKSDLSAPAFE
jgi:hypothetical protein